MLRCGLGIVDFREIREEGFVYIDKTDCISMLVGDSYQKVSLITRPRRFGKTLTMSMFSEFFDIRKNSFDIFDGLKITKDIDLCEKWMNKYPVIALSLKKIMTNDFRSSISMFSDIIHTLCVEHSYLICSDKVDLGDKKILQKFSIQEASDTDLYNSIEIFSRSLESYWNKKVIILIDEYDVPLNYAWHHGYYTEMVDFIRCVFGAAFKDNRYLKFAVLTGCLRIAKESIFTGVNNFRCYPISQKQYSDSFGFTGVEVDSLLENTPFRNKRKEIADWYDGYHFGENTDIYCPWDVLNFLMDLNYDPDATPKPYWINTSSNDIIKDFIEFSNFSIKEKIETLLEGGFVKTSIIEDITYDNIYTSEEHFWSVLYATGYLTKVKTGFDINSIEKTLRIPNREILSVFNNEAKNWLAKVVRKNTVRTFFLNFWNGNAEEVASYLSRLLLHTISFYDYHENFYHAFLLGLFARDEYIVRSNQESGEGRPDIIVRDVLHNRCAVIEVKWEKTASASLAVRANAALEQIRQKHYLASLDDTTNDAVHCWGLAFTKKKCQAAYALWKTI